MKQMMTITAVRHPRSRKPMEDRSIIPKSKSRPSGGESGDREPRLRDVGVLDEASWDFPDRRQTHGGVPQGRFRPGRSQVRKAAIYRP